MKQGIYFISSISSLPLECVTLFSISVTHSRAEDSSHIVLAKSQGSQRADAVLSFPDTGLLLMFGKKTGRRRAIRGTMYSND